MTQEYETHFERAARIGMLPDELKAEALAGEAGSFGSSDGMIYFPRSGRDMRFFVELMAKKHNVDPDW